MPSRDSYRNISEFSWDDILIHDKEADTLSPVLRPPSCSYAPGTSGYCRYYACTDVINHRRSLLELTRPPATSAYYGQIFADGYSTQQLIDNNLGEINQLLSSVEQNGLTSDIHYRHRARKVDNNPLKDVKGCPIHRIDGWKIFPKNWIDPVTRYQETVKWADLVASDILHFGPTLGTFACTSDIYQLCQEFLYVPDTRMMLVHNSRVQSHATMVVGFGSATSVLTNKETLYFVIQNNWGARVSAIGRLPIEHFAEMDILKEGMKNTILFTKHKLEVQGHPWKARMSSVGEVMDRH
ncbi:hypothetical protein OROHE_016071 [Orobanche hederae]